MFVRAKDGVAGVVDNATVHGCGQIKVFCGVFVVNTEKSALGFGCDVVIVVLCVQKS